MPSKKLLITIAKVTIATAILYFLISSGRIDFEKLTAVVADPATLVKSFLLLQGMMALTAVRWHLTLGVGNAQIRFRKVFAINFIASFATSFLPAMGGADAVRGYYTVKSIQDNRTGAAVSIIADRLISLYGILTIIVLSIPFVWPLIQNSWLLRYVTGMSVIAYVMAIGLFVFMDPIHRFVISRSFFHSQGKARRIKDLFLRATDTLMVYRHNLPAVFICLLITLLANCMTAYCLLVIAQSIGLDGLQFAEQVFATSLTSFVNVAILTPNGIGVGEAAYEVIASRILGTNEVLGYASAFLAFRVLWIINSLPGLGFYLTYNTQKTQD